MGSLFMQPEAPGRLKLEFLREINRVSFALISSQSASQAMRGSTLKQGIATTRALLFSFSGLAKLSPTPLSPRHDPNSAIPLE
jgi:hypothetical protein